MSHLVGIKLTTYCTRNSVNILDCTLLNELLWPELVPSSGIIFFIFADIECEFGCLFLTCIHLPRLNGSANKIKLSKCDVNSVKLNS